MSDDGSVEFCLPADDAASLTAVQAVSKVNCGSGSSGRAGCNPATELLCFLPTGMAECVAPQGAMTDKTWQTVCKISTVDAVTKIVPTVAE